MPKLLPIALKGAPVLRQRAVPVDNVHDPEIIALVEGMIDTMYEARGIGLAANQVGVAKQIAVIDPRSSRHASKMMMGGTDVSDLNDWLPLVMINPKVTAVDSPTVTQMEGCLSQPGVSGKVTRPLTIKVSWISRYGTPHEAEFSGMIARVIQHEVDHLNGILFTDRALKAQ